MNDIMNARRQKLAQSVKDAALALFEHMGSAAAFQFRLVDDSELWVYSGDTDVLAMVKKLKASEARVTEFEEREAACCPEDIAFEELIDAQARKLEEADSAMENVRILVNNMVASNKTIIRITARKVLAILPPASGQAEGDVEPCVVEREHGRQAARALARHLLAMGAASVQIPVELDGHELFAEARYASAEQRAEKLVNNDRCPTSCDDEHVRYGEVVVEGLNAIRECTCVECEAHWHEVYTLVDRVMEES